MYTCRRTGRTQGQTEQDPHSSTFSWQQSPDQFPGIEGEASLSYANPEDAGDNYADAPSPQEILVATQIMMRLRYLRQPSQPLHLFSFLNMSVNILRYSLFRYSFVL